MVTLIGAEPFHEEVKINHRVSCGHRFNNNRYPRHSHKSKHSLKLKCKSLYKYRLRRNGEEDPDVLDISHMLLSTLKIKSPSKFSKSPGLRAIEELRPKNYLSKMARRKQKIKTETSETVSQKIIEEDISCAVQECQILEQNEVNRGVSSEIAVPEKLQTKQTNAFQLLMDSRNKSIGSNSPGKEKVKSPTKMQEVIEKKSLKVKRILALQKLAEAKGSLKKKEMEQNQEKIIQKKMAKRAERLKNMIKPKECKPLKVIKRPPSNTLNKVEVIDVEDDSTDEKHSGKVSKEKSKWDNPKEKVVIDNKVTKSLKLVDIFKDINKESQIKNIIPKEDEEFLNKLSPSIKKKENMLCYFKKIDMKCPISKTKNDDKETEPNTVLKVKVYKNKNKLKKKKLSLCENPTTEVLKDHNENSSSANTEIQNVVHNFQIYNSEGADNDDKICNRKKKRKREKDDSMNKECKFQNIDDIESNTDINERPKIRVKKAIKYNNDIQLTSDDEELHIFTPRKKKRTEDNNTYQNKEPLEEIVISKDESKKKVSTKSKNNFKKEEKTQKQPTKLAPIFAPKPQLNSEQLEAKQKFLCSGVPDQIKKMIAQQKSKNSETYEDFPVVVHVQQNQIINVDTPIGFSLSSDYDSDDQIVSEEGPISQFVVLHESENSNDFMPSLKNNPTTTLENIKKLHSKFPVHRIFRMLKTKSKDEFKDIALELENSSEVINEIIDVVNENPEYLNWTDKYKATSTKHLIGNFESIKELKRWLQSWIEFEFKKKNKGNGSDSSDFYDSDSNSRDSFKNNLLIVSGPVGCGKTSSVYAVAADLAIKVIEVNASSKRTGKVMLQDLQEATQSHKVNRGGSDNSQKSQEIVETVSTIVPKKKGRPKKLVTTLKKVNSGDEKQSLSQENVRTAMSLILVDDADIVFEQDDGFSSAISQLIQCSKRPVILVTSSLSCPHLQKFLQYGKIINLHPLLPRILGTWLDIMCLADGTCWPGLGAKFLDYFKGDIRKSINCLQFYMASYSQKCSLTERNFSQNSEYKLNSDDENSNSAWPGSEQLEDENVIQTFPDPNDVVWKYFMSKDSNLLHLRYPRGLFSVWWNVSNLIKQAFSGDCYQIEENYRSSSHKLPKEMGAQVLETIADVIDSISVSDYYSRKSTDIASDLTSKPWYSSISDSVSEQENFEGYDKCHDVTGDILQEIVETSVFKAQDSLKCKKSTFIQFPSMAQQREKDRLLSHHENLMDILNPSMTLDRKALAVDYWSACRTICRIEKTKTDTTSKRNNRFYHYLKSMSGIGRNRFFDCLADSLVFQ